MVQLSMPTKVFSDEGAIEYIGETIKDYGERVFLAYDMDSSRDTGSFTKIKKLLERNSYGVLSYNLSLLSLPNVTNTNIVNKGAEQARHARCDVVIGFGNISTLYIAKAIAYLISNEGKIEDYLHGKQGSKKKINYIEIPVNYNLLPGIANFTYLIDKDNKTSKSISTEVNYADLVIADTSLMVPTSPKESGYLGINILSLAIEALLSRKGNILSQSFALRALGIIFAQIKNFTKDPSNLNFKTAMANASILASLAISNSCPGACFALSMAINATYGINHETASTILLPYIMEYNITSSANQYMSIFQTLGKSIEGVTVVESAIKMIEEVRKLIEELGLEKSFKPIHVDKNDFPTVARTACNYDFMNYIPRTLSEEEVINILDTAY